MKKVSVYDRLNSNLDSFIANTELKVLITNKLMNTVVPRKRSSDKSCLVTKPTRSPHKVTFADQAPKQNNTSIEMDFTNDVILKTILKNRMYDQGKVRKGKFKTDKINHVEINKKLMNFIDLQSKANEESNLHIYENR